MLWGEGGGGRGLRASECQAMKKCGQSAGKAAHRTGKWAGSYGAVSDVRLQNKSGWRGTRVTQEVPGRLPVPFLFVKLQPMGGDAPPPDSLLPRSA